MQYMYVRYGVLERNANLKLPFSSEENFHSEVSTMDATFHDLQSVIQPKSEADKMSFLQEATIHLVGVSGAVNDYKRRIQPDIGALTFWGIVDHIKEQSSNFATTGDAGYAGTVAVNTANSIN